MKALSIFVTIFLFLAMVFVFTSQPASAADNSEEVVQFAASAVVANLSDGLLEKTYPEMNFIVRGLLSSVITGTVITAGNTILDRDEGDYNAEIAGAVVGISFRWKW